MKHPPENGFGRSGIVPIGEPVMITPEMRLRDLDRCDLTVWCQGRCRHGRRLPVRQLIDRFGLDALLVGLAPRFRCATPGCGGLGHMKVERRTGVHRPCGTDPCYD